MKYRSKDGDELDAMPGNPLFAAEGEIIAFGFRSGVAGLWSIASARHEITGGGFTHP